MINQKIFFIVLFLCGTINLIFAQTKDEDIASADKLIQEAKSEPQNAIEYCKSASKLYEQWEQWEAFLYAQKHLAKAQENAAKIDESEATYLAILEQIPAHLDLPHILEGQVNFSLGEFYRVTRQSKKSKKHLESSLNWYDTNEGKSAKPSGDVYISLGLLSLFSLNAPQDAMDYFLKALAVNSKYYPKGHMSKASIYNKIATSYRYQGDPESALKYFSKSMLIAKGHSAENASLLQSNYNNMGATFMDMGQFPKAIESFGKSIETQVVYGLPANFMPIISRANIADCYAIQEKHKEALVHYKDAYESMKVLYGEKSPDVAHICNNMTVTLMEMGEVDSALYYTQKSLIANVIDFDEMDVLKNPSSDNFHFLDEMEALYALGNKSANLHDVYLKTKDLKYLEAGYDVLNLTLSFFDKLESGNKSARDKVYLYQNIQETFVVGVKICMLLYELTNDKDYQQRAFSIAEVNKAALLRQALQEDNAQNFGGVPDSLLKLEQQFKQQIAHYENEWLTAELSKEKENALEIANRIFEEKKSYRALKKQFEESFSDYFQLKYNKETPQIIDLQQLLDSDAALVSYLWNPPECFAFVLLKDTTYVVDQSLPNLGQEVDSLFALLHTSKLAMKNPVLFKDLYSKYAYGLYQNLIGNLALPKSIQQLLVIPDGSLHYIPFEALLQSPVTDQKQKTPTFDYLLKRYSIHYVYSASLFQQLKLRKKGATNNRMLAIAPSYEKAEKKLLASRSGVERTIRKNLNKLPGVQEEVQQLDGLFQGAFLYGLDANEASFKEKATGFGILHFAMHGLLDSKNSTNSSLVFTENGDGIEDNFLHAYEINNLKLNAQLVVLSACETGHGKFESGEGVMSLARSFMYAGANSVMATLWQVNDASMVILMESFYQNLSEGMTKSEALGQAKLSYLERASEISGHPAFWAAPVLIGDNAALIIQKKTNWWILGGVLVIGLLLVGFIWRRQQS